MTRTVVYVGSVAVLTLSVCALAAFMLLRERHTYPRNETLRAVTLH